MKHLKLNTVAQRSAGAPFWLSRLGALLRPAVGCFALHSLLVFAAALYGAEKLSVTPGGFLNPFLATSSALVEPFLRWDAHWYTYVAQHGYTPQSIVFFPALPLLIRLVAQVSQLDYALAGFLVCNSFALLSFVLLYWVARLDYSPAASRRTLLVYALFPTSYYLNSIYTEPLFLTFALGCVLAARKGWWPAAALLAALTAVTRNLGLGIELIVLYELYRQRRTVRWYDVMLALTVPLLALGGFLWFNARLTGDWLAFMHMQMAWGRDFCLPWTNIAQAVQMVRRTQVSPQPGLTLDLILVLVALIFLTLATVRPSRRLYRPYLALGWLWLIIPLCSTTPWLPIYSLSRFTLVLFPLFFCVAEWPVAAYRWLLIAGAAGLAVYTALFAGWHWVS